MTHFEEPKARLAKVAGEIDRLLSEVILLQKDYVTRVCPACTGPCCKRVWLVFDEKDIIFARVFLNHKISSRGVKRTNGCPFLTMTGCQLGPKRRPFACHRYLCSGLKEEMAKQEPELLQVLNQKFRVLEHLRGRLWKEYLRGLQTSDGPQYQKPT